MARDFQKDKDIVINLTEDELLELKSKIKDCKSGEEINEISEKIINVPIVNFLSFSLLLLEEGDQEEIQEIKKIIERLKKYFPENEYRIFWESVEEWILLYMKKSVVREIVHKLYLNITPHGKLKPKINLSFIISKGEEAEKITFPELRILSLIYISQKLMEILKDTINDLNNSGIIDKCADELKYSQAELSKLKKDIDELAIKINNFKI